MPDHTKTNSGLFMYKLLAKMNFTSNGFKLISNSLCLIFIITKRDKTNNYWESKYVETINFLT